MRIFLLALILFPINLYAQDWVFVEPDDNLIKSVVAITGTKIIDGEQKQIGATGVIVEKTNTTWSLDTNFVLGKVLTVHHFDATNIEVIFSNNRKSKASSIKYDEDVDLRLLSCYIHKDMNVVEVYNGDNPTGIVYGLGGLYEVAPSRTSLRVFTGERIGPKRSNYYLNTCVISGDSGGPIFYQNKLVGIVQGGNSWFDRDDNKGSFTWPLRTASQQSIRKFLNGK